MNEKLTIVFELDPRKIPDTVRNFCAVNGLDLQLFIAYALSSDYCFIQNPCMDLINILSRHRSLSSALFDILTLKKES